MGQGMIVFNTLQSIVMNLINSWAYHIWQIVVLGIKCTYGFEPWEAIRLFDEYKRHLRGQMDMERQVQAQIRSDFIGI